MANSPDPGRNEQNTGNTSNTSTPHAARRQKHENREETKVDEKESKSYRNHKNPIVRAFAKTGYAVWLSILIIGGVLAFIVSIIAV